MERQFPALQCCYTVTERTQSQNGAWVDGEEVCLKDCPLFEDVNTSYVCLFCFHGRIVTFSVFLVEMFVSGVTLPFVSELNFCSEFSFFFFFFC